MANAVMQTGRSNGTRGENYDYAFKLRASKKAKLILVLCANRGESTMKGKQVRQKLDGLRVPEFKVMLIGDSGVGKTCILVRFKDGAFLSGSFISTVGIDFKNKTIELDGSKIKLQIWDTAGQERFRSITHAYYRDAHALLLLYDVSSRKSFENTRAWLSEIQEYTSGDVVVMLLGNKADLSREKAVKREEGEKLAKDFQVPFMETSAKSGLNVELAFEAAARELVRKQGMDTNLKKFDISTYVQDKEERPGCCGGS